MDKQILAIMYDFDKTLSLTDMQAYKLIKDFGLTPEEFWKGSNNLVNAHDMDKILGFLLYILILAKEKNIKITREYLNECGKDISYHKGVLTWFDRINEYALSKGIIVEHYIISSGNKEILEKCEIADKFKAIFGCEYIYDEITKEAIWPKVIINYTLKTQYIYRVTKGLLDSNDDREINEKSHNKRINPTNMIYIGDGQTDIPAMINVKENGGYSVAVYVNDSDYNHDETYKLYKDNRVNLVCEADYSKDSILDDFVKSIIDNMSVINKIDKKIKSLS